MNKLDKIFEERRHWRSVYGNMDASPLFFMFEKISKRFGSKAADSAVEGVKETLNDKLEDYSGIIKIGLVLAVIIFGGKHLIKPEKDNSAPVFNPKLPSGGQPIIINNYYHEPKGDWIEYGGQRKNYQKYQNRR